MGNRATASKRIGAAVLALAAAPALSGCVQGQIFSRTTRPLMTDFSATPVSTHSSRGDVQTVTFYVDVEWGDGGIGEIARRKGISEIYYADVETTTVLGYWKRDLVRVYGRGALDAGGVAAGGVPAGTPGSPPAAVP